MLALAKDNLVILVIALLVAIVVAYWVFRSGRRTDSAADERTQATPRARRAVDGPEGNSLPDEIGAATRDVAGEFLGVDAHVMVPSADGPPDNLQTMKGVGPKLAAQLNECGITRFEQLARLGPNEVAMVDARMGPFQGRIERDRLVEQACYLARGDTDGFEANFGRLGGSA
jgi:predicted flap endonuclease-1-like 5' DNA nuclease